MSDKILQRGAEAVILLKNNYIIKRRIKKSYRLNVIDEKIRKLRTRSEAKLLEKASKVIDVPKIKKVDEKLKEISMEFIEGKKLSDNLDSFPLEKQKEICNTLGKSIAKLHDADIIHGDLTTSNMIYVNNKKINNKNTDEGKRGDNKTSVINLNNAKGFNNKNSVGQRVSNFTRQNCAIHNERSYELGNNNFKIFFIDFGLGFSSHKIEDKAVDLHLLRQALEAKHFKYWQELFDNVLKGYFFSKNSKQVLEQLKKVEARGRYKEAY